MQGRRQVDSKRPDENLCTKDGSLDRYGRPAIKGRTGGWRCAMFILGKLTGSRLKFCGNNKNNVFFLFSKFEILVFIKIIIMKLVMSNFVIDLFLCNL